MNIVRDLALWIVGILVIAIVVDAAVRTFVLPRGAVVRLTRIISVGIRKLFDVRLHFSRTYEQRDRVMAMYSPLVLLALVTVWLGGDRRGVRGSFLRARARRAPDRLLTDAVQLVLPS